MPKITWLESSVPLVKTIEQTTTGLSVTPYPHALNFTSETINIASVSDLTKALVEREKSGKCLLKGLLDTPLNDESRAGHTKSGDKTEWVCFDLDKAPFADPADFMKAIGLGNVSFCVQYSASHGLPNSIGLSCHIFCFLSRPMPAPQLKSWLMYLNFNIKELRDALRLSRTGIALSYPLDITCCQNDKLIFTCAPKFIRMKDPLTNRTMFVKKRVDEIAVEQIPLHAPEALKKMARDILNERRRAAQLPELKAKVVIVGEYEVQNAPGGMTVTGGPKHDRGFVYFNLNGGENWSYFHPEQNYELIHNFKGEPCLRTKEALPEYYKECVAARNNLNATPSTDGDLLLAFRDRRTASYWNGTWNPRDQILELFPAKTETQINHFMQSHGRLPLDFIPLWDLVFDPTEKKIVDVDNHTVNMYVPSDYIKLHKKVDDPNLGGCPTIQKILDNAVGKGDIQEHFLNWLAVIIQKNKKPITAWILHGTQGTGKGLFVQRVLKPLLGDRYVQCRIQNELNSDFTGWLEYALIAFIDEIDHDALDNGGMVESKLKSYITEPTVPIRKMRMDSYEVKNYTGFIFSSNKNKATVVPENDRRYNVGVRQMKSLEITSYEVDVLLKQELQAFADYLMSRKADVKKASTPLHTEDREAIMELSKTSVDYTAQYLLDGNLEGMWEAMPDMSSIASVHDMTPFQTYANAYSALMKRSLTEYLEGKETKFSREELGTLFEYCVGNVPKTAHKLSSYLKHHGIKLSKMRSAEGQLTYGLRVSWFATDEFLKDVKDESSKPIKLRKIK